MYSSLSGIYQYFQDTEYDTEKHRNSDTNCQKNMAAVKSCNLCLKHFNWKVTYKSVCSNPVISVLLGLQYDFRCAKETNKDYAYTFWCIYGDKDYTCDEYHTTLYLQSKKAVCVHQIYSQVLFKDYSRQSFGLKPETTEFLPYSIFSDEDERPLHEPNISFGAEIKNTEVFDKCMNIYGKSNAPGEIDSTRYLKDILMQEYDGSFRAEVFMFERLLHFHDSYNSMMSYEECFDQIWEYSTWRIHNLQKNFRFIRRGNCPGNVEIQYVLKNDCEPAPQLENSDGDGDDDVES